MWLVFFFFLSNLRHGSIKFIRYWSRPFLGCCRLCCMTKLNPFRAHPVKQSKMADLFNPSVQTADASLAVYFQCMATGWGFKRGFDVRTQRVKTPLYKQTHLRSSGSAEQSQPWASVHPCSNSKHFHLLEFTRITRDVLGSVILLCNLLSDQISCSTCQRVAT